MQWLDFSTEEVEPKGMCYLKMRTRSVSYTHLTLPTIYSV